MPAFPSALTLVGLVLSSEECGIMRNRVFQFSMEYNVPYHSLQWNTASSWIHSGHTGWVPQQGALLTSSLPIRGGSEGRYLSSCYSKVQLCNVWTHSHYCFCSYKAWFSSIRKAANGLHWKSGLPVSPSSSLRCRAHWGQCSRRRDSQENSADWPRTRARLQKHLLDSPSSEASQAALSRDEDTAEARGSPLNGLWGCQHTVSHPSCTPFNAGSTLPCPVPPPSCKHFP